MCRNVATESQCSNLAFAKHASQRIIRDLVKYCRSHSPQGQNTHIRMWGIALLNDAVREQHTLQEGVTNSLFFDLTAHTSDAQCLLDIHYSG